MKLYRIQIDFENNADEYWTNDAHRIWNSFECCVRDDNMGALSFTRKSEAERALNKMRELPNWSSPEYPEFAPNPIIDEIYDDEIDNAERLNDLIDDAVHNYISKAWRAYNGDAIDKNIVLDENGEIDSLFDWPSNLIDVKYFYIGEVILDGIDPTVDGTVETTFNEYFESMKSIVREWLKDDVERAFDEWLEWIDSQEGNGDE